MADDRTVSRGEGERGGGRARKSGRLLLWRGWRRRVEDDGRRDSLEANFRQRAGRFDWSDGAGTLESEDYLCGDGSQYDFWGQQPRRWNLQVHGWRGELEARGTGGHPARRENRDRSSESGCRDGGGDGTQLRAQRAARRLPNDGRRADVEESSVQR